MTDGEPEGSRVARPRRRLRRLLLRITTWGAGLAVLVASAGFLYETNARRGDADHHRPPGRLVDVGGHRLHLYCTGTGAPTVVLETGLAESSASWETIQRRLSTGNRVCSYDRAGYAWSEDGPSPRTAERAAGELHTLLAAAGEAGPYVLVGHSYGGNTVRVFADRRRDLTAGLVLIDVTDETAVTALQISRPLLAVQLTVNQLIARLGLLRLLGDALVPAEATTTARTHALVVYGDRSMAAARAESWASVDSAAQVRATVRPRAWGDLPAVVISAGGQPPEVTEHARRLAALSARGRLVVATTTEHYVQNAQPDLVLDAIHEVIAAHGRG
ncbi:alpha/beta fold hydrolase [Streptosporangium roseum]|uniref:Alpha/beta hydrolase fold protein n=1 Tax=Streptosporangium roseum (strain ATCC 12428 / DSM 43021 / JCM 3005 / KCTC 9067 / NCIMB 10171 / NRRL 2505 / NI 9100) TaxID=479432 RepID=D2B5U1_STRRD|nr:alpha/beta hydrolase [Streptosporangium roseum]ACZ91395.1 alpha/beta hydrolase fold protein [Streptosporangium roseum DSM 43021]